MPMNTGNCGSSIPCSMITPSTSVMLYSCYWYHLDINTYSACIRNNPYKSYWLFLSGHFQWRRIMFSSIPIWQKIPPLLYPSLYFSHLSFKVVLFTCTCWISSRMISVGTYIQLPYNLCERPYRHVNVLSSQSELKLAMHALLGESRSLHSLLLSSYNVLSTFADVLHLESEQ